MKKHIIPFLLLGGLYFNSLNIYSKNKIDINNIKSPIYTDDNYFGPADPEIVWNPNNKEWLIFYTGRRPLLDQSSYVGTPIGIASSTDFINWNFKGYCSFDGEKGYKDSEKTFWAPGVIIEGDSAHMYVTKKDDSTPVWGGPSKIVHYVTHINDIVNGWKYKNEITQSPASIDATVIKDNNGIWRMWYRDQSPNSEVCQIFSAESKDLYNWELLGVTKGDVNEISTTSHHYQEGVFVFEWKGYYWMITDPHKGLAVYKSKDAKDWEYQGIILDQPGSRILDNTRARHSSVIVNNDRAFIVYHVQPFLKQNINTHESGDEVYQKISFIQMTELFYKDGKIICNRK